MKSRIFILLVLIVLVASCKKEAANKLKKTPKKTVVAQKDTVFKLECYSAVIPPDETGQKVTYELFLWKKNEQYIGYIYNMVYNSDFFFNEYNGKVIGTVKNDIISLKGDVGEPFEATIKQTDSGLVLDGYYPQNKPRSVYNLKLTNSSELLAKESIQTLSTKQEIEKWMSKKLFKNP